MREVCFCGREGEIGERETILYEAGTRALRCHDGACGHTDHLE